jgi:CysZ protein
MLTKTNNPVYAMQCLMKGLSWLGKTSLRKFLLMPILINLVLYSVAFVLAYVYLLDFIAHLIPAWLHWLAWLLKPLFFICFVLVGFFTFTVLANLIASPFYGKLASKTLALIIENKPEQTEEQEAENSEFEFSEPNWLQVMSGELRRIAYLLKWMCVLVIVSLIPGLNLISPLFWAIFGAWGCALEFFAYPLENKGLLFQEQKSAVANVRFGALSFGAVVLAGLSLPFFNLIVAPAAVIAATFYVHGMDSQQA